MELENMSEDILKTLFLSGLVTFFILSLATLSGYFRLPEEKNSSSMSFLKVIVAFIVYFGSTIVIVPVLLVLGLALYYQEIPKDPIQLLNATATEWLNIVSFAVGSLALVIYSLRDQVWNCIGKPFYLLVKDFLIGMASLAIALPVVIFSSYLAVWIFTTLFQHPPGEEEQVVVKLLKKMTEDSRLLLSAAFVIIFIVPIGEELLFRGYVQSWVRKGLGRVGAIVLTSLLFAFAHFSTSQGLANIQLLTALTVLSFFLGFLYERQQSLWAPIGLHATFNGISVWSILLT